MLFNTETFPLFLAVVLALYFGLKGRARTWLLLGASYCFYSFWNWKFSFLLLLSTIVDYWCGRKLGDSTKKRSQKKIFLVLSLCTNLGILGFFKYFNFFVDSASDFLNLFGLHPSFTTLNIILPVGISFYTFQTLSYTIDIWRGIIRPIKDFPSFALYVSFFPQLVAGPIERARNLIPQIEKLSNPTRLMIWQGALLIVSGYIKKVMIGDQIAPFVDHAFTNWATLSSLELWEGLMLFTLQIYFDFSGYSDIARGVAKWFGIDLMINFRQPYFSSNVSEFWTRWHISLSSWLKEYLYIPLGGNRKGPRRTYINLFLTMLLGGLWHGANFTFVIWGFLHGLYLSVHKILKKNSGSSTRSGVMTLALKIVATHALIVLTWLPFRAPDLVTAVGYFARLFSFVGPFDLAPLAFVGFLYLLLFAIDYPIFKTDDEYVLMRVPKLIRVSYVTIASAIAFFLILNVKHATPFIYFQF